MQASPASHVPLATAREEYLSHQQYCRQCNAHGVPCPAAKHLRRVYNNAARAAASAPSGRSGA
ncbi:hypothetical protein GCM10010377_81810 [Streptomyces viridiviolaceus]|uniref:Uncharacterized protein n=1 Tax=Streptomyces viridiviolaceus TaxID=68282 RepID=A0ABW2EAU7_9ACTN|nr:hypothetical protein [Streptomyces viridiviolaceus]GHB79443.1 hypothetical protein GCM10010377_81810 [Streptomyces viridiviolaceus]